MEQATRNKLRNVVTQCRRLLEEAVRNELQGRFGVYADAKKDGVVVEDEARMTNLADEDRAYRHDLLDHFEHIKAFGTKPKDALAQLVREVAFTHLNRLCAYKMMEAREVYVGGQRFREAVSRGVNSNGVMFYLADHPEDERLFKTGRQDIAYRHFLDWLGGRLSDEIGVLFSPDDPANRLYPPQRVLDDVLALINDDELAGIWSQDEAIGWVYQYFTPKELRDQARKESQAPRNSYELAFRNQFFTPRYVVEFLTDNTLGRIWYEMRKGDTALKDSCRYMVRRPSEVFLAEGLAAPVGAEKDRDDLSQEELLKLPVYVPHRPKKDPREIRLLDPAVGSAHFLLYGFDLLLTIYEEAYTDTDLGPSLQKDYPTHDELLKAVPGLILKHNLHGIDIDLRATQISALALWLRCQRAYQEMGLKRDRPKITRSNVVCAEPMPGERGLMDDFLKTLRDDRLEALISRVMTVPEGRRVRATEAMADSLCELVLLVWEKMRLAGETGSLLKIEEELLGAIRKGQLEWEIKQPLFRITEFGLTEQAKESYVRIIPGEEVTFWEKAEALVTAALEDFVAYASDKRAFQRKLFAEDAMRGFAFVDLCRQRFDVALMNPPFGQQSSGVKGYTDTTYPESKSDLYATFVDRGVSLLAPTGLLGAITSRLGLFVSSLEKWRTRYLLEEHNLVCLADLGHGVLDEALVEAAAYVISSQKSYSTTIWFASALDTADKSVRLSMTVRSQCSERTFSVARQSFLRFPYRAVPYWMPSHFLRSLFLHPSFSSCNGVACVGLQTDDDFRFLRLAWECPIHEVNHRWRYFAKGGEYSPYYDDIHMVVDWKDNGGELRRFIEQRYSWTKRASSAERYGNPGLTYPERTTSEFSL